MGSQDDASWEALAEVEGASPAALAPTAAAGSAQARAEAAGPAVAAQQAQPPHLALPSAPALSPGEQAVAAEAWHEVALFEDDVRRQHIHWVHSRTNDPGDVQPESFTREDIKDLVSSAGLAPDEGHRLSSTDYLGN